MDFVQLWAFLVVISTLTVWEIHAISRRQKRDDVLFRRLESLSSRVENIEADLRQEQRKSRSLEAELNELKKRITTIEEKPKGRGEVGELPEAAVKTLSDLARKTFQVDLDVLKSGMIAGKQRAVQTDKAVEFCKLSLNRQSSRLDDIDRNVSELDGRLRNLSTTVTAVNRSCSQCSARASDKGSEIISGKCPLFERIVISRKTLSSVDLLQLLQPVCEKQNFVYAFYVTVQKIMELPNSESRTAEITIGAGTKIGDRQIHHNTRAVVSLSRDCPWPDVQESKHYLILTDQALIAHGLRRSLSLKNSVIFNFNYEGPPDINHLLNRYIRFLLYSLRKENWRRLCRAQK
ncbi:uncharacterized protein LOC135465824 [Liolophura sinensis]|uniref:uncharacterized protein LOC135465824 n=1 Tax=Liolophura sinensis TaxID=3198878 RepID=UPI0031587887